MVSVAVTAINSEKFEVGNGNDPLTCKLLRITKSVSVTPKVVPR